MGSRSSRPRIATSARSASWWTRCAAPDGCRSPRAGDRQRGPRRHQARLESARPSQGWLAGRAAWAHFIEGGWLERLVTAAIRSVAPGHELYTGVRMRCNDTALEVDVIAVGEYRPTVISCTVSGSGRVAKQKAFEVLRRAQQTGGRVARPALVSMLDDRSLPRASTIAHSLADQSPAPTALRVYDSRHVLDWANALATGEEDRLAELRHWVLD
jgi:hypothetical protein